MVSPTEPRQQLGVYWGYKCRIAQDFNSIFEECPYEGGYDVRIGTSDRGASIAEAEIPRHRHCLVVFGGLAGIEDLLESDESVESKRPEDFFSLYLNTCPVQGARTIRTEEALLITLAALSLKMS